LTHGGNIDERLLSPDEFMLVYGNYPYPSEHFLEIVNRYQVSYIMSAPEFLNNYRKKIMKKADDFDRTVQILWETPTLLIGKIVR
jgi:acyl-coenzyme A synthetase/AMP-(fatty) acid ligase